MYTDVPRGVWYYDQVDFVTRYGFMNGMGDGTFAPSGNVNRAQFVVILYRMAGFPEVAIDNPFVDVPAQSWFTDAVLWAYANGITNGTSATEFSPSQKCSRAQVVTFLWRAQGAPESAAEVSFSDVEAGKFYSAAVTWAVENGITNGMGDGTFGVGGICNRAQAATFLYRLYK